MKCSNCKKIIPDNTKPLARFVEQAHEIWGNHYDYTDSVYDGGKKPIIIYCPKHDYHFRVAMAQNHILKPHGTFTPTGCPICRAEITHKTEYGKDWRKYLKVSKKLHDFLIWIYHRQQYHYLLLFLK